MGPDISKDSAIDSWPMPIKQSYTLIDIRF